jgi:hypothetical protein
MLQGSGNPTPFDGYALFALCLLALVLLVGCIVGPGWPKTTGLVLRWGALGLAALVLGAVLVVSPTTSATIGAGRLISIYPAAAAVAVLFLIWCWRLGHL